MSSRACLDVKGGSPRTYYAGDEAAFRATSLSTSSQAIFARRGPASCTIVVSRIPGGPAMPDLPSVASAGSPARGRDDAFRPQCRSDGSGRTEVTGCDVPEAGGTVVRNIVSRTLRVVRRARLPAGASAHQLCNGVESFPWRGTPSSDLAFASSHSSWHSSSARSAVQNRGARATYPVVATPCPLGAPRPRSTSSLPTVRRSRSAYAAASISSKTSS